MPGKQGEKVEIIKTYVGYREAETQTSEKELPHAAGAASKLEGGLPQGRFLRRGPWPAGVGGRGDTIKLVLWVSEKLPKRIY